MFKNLWKSRAWYGMMISYYIMALFGKEIIDVKEKRQQKENFAKWREPKKRWSISIPIHEHARKTKNHIRQRLTFA